jgi:mannonate dehydratase
VCRRRTPYGIARGDHYEPAERGPLSENGLEHEPYLAVVPPLFERLRRELGSEIALLHDAHHRLTPIEAARSGARWSRIISFWLEDPTPADNPEVFR